MDPRAAAARLRSGKVPGAEQCGVDPIPVVITCSWRNEERKCRTISEHAPDLLVRPIPAPVVDEDTMITSVPAWVDYHYARLEELEVEPPYVLVGWSFGGVFALELARRLRAEGRSVAYVGLLDTIRPSMRPVRLRDAVPYHLKEAAYLSNAEARHRYLMTEAKNRVTRRVPRLYRAWHSLRGRDVTPAAKLNDPLRRSLKLSYWNYDVEPVDFNVTVFATKGSIARESYGDPSLRWAPKFRSGLNVVPIPGSHFTMWKAPYAESVVGALATDIANAYELAPTDRRLPTTYSSR